MQRNVDPVPPLSSWQGMAHQEPAGEAIARGGRPDHLIAAEACDRQRGNRERLLAPVGRTGGSLPGHEMAQAAAVFQQQDAVKVRQVCLQLQQPMRLLAGVVDFGSQQGGHGGVAGQGFHLIATCVEKRLQALRHCRELDRQPLADQLVDQRLRIPVVQQAHCERRHDSRHERDREVATYDAVADGHSGTRAALKTRPAPGLTRSGNSRRASWRSIRPIRWHGRSVHRCFRNRRRARPLGERASRAQSGLMQVSVVVLGKNAFAA